MITAEKLKQRALKALYNKDEIDDIFVQKSVDDALEFSYGKAVMEHFVEDYAYIRLKIYLKIELSPEDELLYKEAIKAIKEAGVVDDSGEIKSSHFIKIAAKKGYLE